jgi:hypothetical protein
VNVGDLESTGVGAGTEVAGYDETDDDSDNSITYLEQGDTQAIVRWGTASVFDRREGRAWFWASAPGTMVSWDWASPIRSILHWWLSGAGIMQVHGGAVGRPSGGIIVVGRGGSGKSTVSLTSLQAGLRYAGDDFVALEPGDAPYVHSLYSSGKLEPHHLERFPALEDAVVNPVRGPRDKAIVLAARKYPNTPIAGFPLSAIVVPRVTGLPDTFVRQISSAAALEALAPSTIFQLHPPRPDALAVMARVARQVPCVELGMGTDLAQVPPAVVRIIDGDVP